MRTFSSKLLLFFLVQAMDRSGWLREREGGQDLNQGECVFTLELKPGSSSKLFNSCQNMINFTSWLKLYTIYIILELVVGSMRVQYLHDNLILFAFVKQYKTCDRI